MTQAEYLVAFRAFLKDEALKNRLLKFTEESTDDELDLYLNMALGWLSIIPPPLGMYTFETFPNPALLIHQATIECLISNSILQARNDLTYNNGGITIKVDDGERYLRLIQLLINRTDRMIEWYIKLKVSLNIENAFGGVFSPYAYLHGTAATLQPNSILSD